MVNNEQFLSYVRLTTCANECASNLPPINTVSFWSTIVETLFFLRILYNQVRNFFVENNKIHDSYFTNHWDQHHMCWKSSIDQPLKNFYRRFTHFNQRLDDILLLTYAILSCLLQHLAQFFCLNCSKGRVLSMLIRSKENKSKT